MDAMSGCGGDHMPMLTDRCIVQENFANGAGNKQP